MLFRSAEQGIFNGKLSGIPRAKLAAAFAVSQPLEAMRCHPFNRREPQHVHRGIQHMDTNINQRSTCVEASSSRVRESAAQLSQLAVQLETLVQQFRV